MCFTRKGGPDMSFNRIGGPDINFTGIGALMRFTRIGGPDEIYLVVGDSVVDGLLVFGYLCGNLYNYIHNSRLIS